MEIEEELFGCRVDLEARKPSAEAPFHDCLLSLPGVGFVGHVHPIAVNQLLCSPRARELAEERRFPDELVCRGSARIFVPYTDPGFRPWRTFAGTTALGGPQFLANLVGTG